MNPTKFLPLKPPLRENRWVSPQEVYLIEEMAGYYTAGYTPGACLLGEWRGIIHQEHVC
jgi:hypothetical protein